MTNLKKILQDAEDQLTLDPHLKMSIFNQLSQPKRKFNPLVVYSTASAALVGVLALAFFLHSNTSPLANGTNQVATNSGPLTFLEQASAAYHSYTKSLGANEVHHVILKLDDGRPYDTLDNIIQETWSAPDGKMRFLNKSFDGKIMDDRLILDEQAFVTQSYLQSLAQSAEQNKQFERADDLSPEDFPRLPEGVSGNTSMEPIDKHTYKICAEFAPAKSSDTLAKLDFLQKIEPFLNPMATDGLPDIVSVIDELSHSSLVEDLGTSDSQEFGTVRTFRISYLDSRTADAPEVAEGVDYVFDEQSLQLKYIHNWYQDPNTVTEGTFNMTILTDEVVDLSSINPSLFDPQAAGLVLLDMSQYPEFEEQAEPTSRVIIPESGCYTYNVDARTLTKQ